MSWKIDSAHSEINFSVKHMMIANVRGQFERFTGTVDFNEQEPALSSVDVQIEVASVNTREAQRDAHLRSPDFFDAENHPWMTFKSKQIEVLDDTYGKIVGDLTIRGTTREVVLHTEYNGMLKSPFGSTNAGFSARTTINRKDWKLGWNVVLESGGVLVGEEVKISIDLEIIKEEEKALDAVA